MRHDDGRPDAVQQGRPDIAHDTLSVEVVGHSLHLRGEELVEDGITRATGAGPLMVQLGLPP